MKPGRELDALVAMKVMPHPPKNIPNRRKYLDKEGVTVIPSYSTDIAAAWEVVEKLNGLGFNVFLEEIDARPGYYAWKCELTRKEGASHTGIQEMAYDKNGAPHAICLAALKAVEI